MCPLNEGAIEEHHDANDNVTPTGSPSIIGTKSLRRSSKGHSSTTTISPSFLFAFLFVGVPLSYYAGRLFQPQVLQLLLPSRTMLPSATGGQSGAITTVEEKESPVLSTRRGALLEAAIYRRTRMKKGGSPVEECAQEEITVEEIFFPEEEAFGQYRMLLTEDDEEDEEEEEDDDEENDEKENDDDQVDTRVDTRVVHVIMDIERVNSEFLKDADRIREAIFETVWEASAEEQDISILSVHCQKMTTGGIFCAVILKGGNHMTVMTDPVGKLCSVDLSVMGEGHLLKVVPMLEEHFGVVGDSSIEKPLMRFRQLFRGPRYFAGRWETMDNDITELLLEYKSDFFFKKEIGSMTSGFQEIHVWEGLNPRLRSVDGYERSMQTGVNNYYTQNPELFRPNRQLYMDGVMQSSTIGDEAYHEGLVHPAMFAHAEGPKRVAIIGGGEGATLREILKHKSVEVCTMIEIDPGIVKASRLWLPRMNDCSDFGTGNCFDERRTELLLEDAFGYFLNRFKREGEIPEELKTDPYDVIVMDALDPDDTIEFAVQMYQDTVFWGTLNEALTHSGILVVQLGMTPDSKSYGEQFGVFKNRANLFQSVEGAGFEQMFIYHDTHSDFKFPWSYLIACKSKDCASEWKRNEAEMSLRMHERILPSKSGKPMLKHFDGATMQSYMRPYKTWESVHCKKEPTPEECTLFDGTSLAVSWDDAFELVYVEGDGKTNQILVAKMDLIAGATIFDDRGTSGKGLSSMITEQHPQHPFPTVDAATWSRPTCGVTRKLSNVDLSGKISPLRERQSHLFEMVETTKDVSKGERFIC